MTISQMTYLENNDLEYIIDSLRLTKGVDLRDYAKASLKRRVERFFDIKNLKGIDEFVKRLNTEKEFEASFMNEVTVNVTEMFRDPEFWVKMKTQVLPELDKLSLINIWHAACATGEEVYTMAIILKELGIYNKCRIVATDINTFVLEHAEKGIYKKSRQEFNEKNFSKYDKDARLEDYYKSINKTEIQLDSGLIKNVRFVKHDLVTDNVVSKFDLIICRNVFIYFSFKLQERVLDLFRNSMESGSFLGLGSKESISITSSEKFFIPVNNEEKIYQKK